MAKFRTNHERRMKPGRFLFFLLFASVLIFLLLKVLKVFKKYEETIIQSKASNNEQLSVDALTLITDEWKEVGLPTTRQGQNNVVIHRYYILSYSEPDEQAEWISYILTREHLNMNKLRRFNYFGTDDLILTGSSNHFDYMGSGYSRGHLAPAGDMSFDSIANKESFYMSNISPQVSEFNKGIWRELEENVRDWARAYKRLFIVTGPVLNTATIKKIGKNQVTVPSLFYKVALDLDGPDANGIGFIIPNIVSDRPLHEYLVTIDSVEQITGINFFNLELPDPIIETAEKSVFKNHWPISKSRFMERIRVWNKMKK